MTSFNLKDEQEDGEFTKDGSFVWKKKEEIRDNWLDNIDWKQVKTRTKAEEDKQEAEDEKEDAEEAKYDEIDTLKQMLCLLQPKETVAKALRRLGGGKKTTAQKLKEKKRQKEGKETEEEKSKREQMEKLTGLADSVLTRSGHMEIYEETFESISFKLKQEEEKRKPKTVIPEDMDEDDALDLMLEGGSDDKDSEKEKEEKTKEEEPKVSLSNEVGFLSSLIWKILVIQ